ncbi:hypothetical protein [Wolbachia endosymbiont of Drosophila pseudotakahashii]|nr:hypothetical protein [Wolbachia endosymbiont of Drosophila pseudotakahashii]ONI57424.1 hypothetical protein N499_0886 [Wolbachia pipientis wVitA]UZE38506.1 hypothetical protein ONI09_06550 [Wolbachia endosymbiont of Drosophila pseudotakahashii]
MKLSTNFVKHNKWCHSSLESRKKNGVIPVPKHWDPVFFTNSPKVFHSIT